MLLQVLEIHWLGSVEIQDAGITRRCPAAQSAMLGQLQHKYFSKYVLKCHNYFGRYIIVNISWNSLWWQLKKRKDNSSTNLE
jgi:putative Mn2+ efflux pump MntP